MARAEHVVVVLFTLVILVLRASTGISGADWTDRAVSGQNFATAATLDGPESVALTPGGGPTPSFVVDWESAPASMAAAWRVFRTAACESWVPSAEDLMFEGAATEWTDSSVILGQTYCYAVQAVRGGWSSTMSGSIAGDLSGIVLYPAPGAGAALSAEPVAGSTSFHCLLVVLGLCTLPGTQSLTWESAPATAMSSAGWSYSIDASVLTLLSIGSPALTATVWQSPSTCGAAPLATDPATVAQATITLGGAQTYTGALAANANFQPQLPTATLCYAIAASPATLQLISLLTIRTGLDTFIQGSAVQ